MFQMFHTFVSVTSVFIIYIMRLINHVREFRFVAATVVVVVYFCR